MWSRPLTLDLPRELGTDCGAPSLCQWLAARRGSVRRLRLHSAGLEAQASALAMLTALAGGSLAALELCGWLRHSPAVKPLAVGPWAFAFPQLRCLWLADPLLDAASCLPLLTPLTALCLDCNALGPSAHVWACGLPSSLRALELRGLATCLPQPVLAGTHLERLCIVAHEGWRVRWDGLERLAPRLTTLVLADCHLSVVPDQVCAWVRGLALSVGTAGQGASLLLPASPG